MGIGGVGMAALAVLLKRRGATVDGCDIKATERTKWLESLGVPVTIGHDAKHISVGVDLMIVTPAVAKDNPEYLAAKAGAEVKSRGEVLAEIVNAAPDSIAVSGSHGKTTTATFIAKLLIALGEKVEWAIGGETGSFPVAGGEDGVLVVEADESDGTLAKYRAKTLVVTNVDYDHPDHFKTREAYVECFETAKRQAAKVILGGATNEETAIAVALSRGHTLERIETVLPQITSELPDRRFQRLADGVYADYGHHPTEVAYSLRRARSICRGKLRVVFQPHRYSRTKQFLQEFAAALSSADEVVLCPVYSAFEKPVEGGTSAHLYAEMRKQTGPRVYLAKNCEEAWEHVRNSQEDGDVMMIQGAGDVLEKVKSESEKVKGKRRVFVGAGTNTVKSDLKTDVEYVKTEGPAGKIAGKEVLEIAPWMAGIPGTLGGWVKMNAGAHGHSISEVIEQVKVDGEWIDAADCGFGYRTSAIEDEIQDVRFKTAGLYPAAQNPGVEYYLAKRRKFPACTKGSVFKNPQGDFAGRLLEAAGVKGLKVGGAYVWEEHANVIVAPSGVATASDFLALVEIMAEKVYFKFGVRLEPEVRFL